MKRTTQKIALLTLLPFFTGFTLISRAQTVIPSVGINGALPVDSLSLADSQEIDSTYLKVRDLQELLDEMDNNGPVDMPIIKITGPWIFSGYRHINKHKPFEMDYTPVYEGMKVATNDFVELDSLGNEIIPANLTEIAEGIVMSPDSTASVTLVEDVEEPGVNMNVFKPDYIPEWLRDAVLKMRLQDDLIYSTMINYPSTIDYTYWSLPVPPTLPEDDLTFQGYLKKLNLPEIEVDKAILPEEKIGRIYWLHNFNSMAQFSQAFISPNWYQGGNNHLSLLLGLSWNVQLNQVYYPNLLFQSNLSYKLGLNSTPQDQVHKYSISEDLLQWNLNVGLKALKKWYYSFNATFKTQIFNNYPANSRSLSASFLSPGDLNLGLGMSYSTKTKTVQLTTTISPLSYNLKTCISDKIDHKQFNIAPNRKTHSEIGSNAEVNLNWQIRYNIKYQTRLFLFTDYKYSLTDWEQTFNFEINKFLSTQIYLRMRYDTSSDVSTGWKHFMLREVLSFGLSYTFSTK